MKSKNKIYIFLLAITISLLSCTNQFEDFKNDDVRLTSEDVSAKFFFPSTQTNLYMPAGWNYLFANVMLGSAYGGYGSFGYKNSWESPDVVFNTTRSWGAAGNDWGVFSGYFLTIDGFLRQVKPGGTLENNLMEAVGNIMKASYFSIYTDLWGELPYSEVGQEGVLTPKFDTQETIYKGLIDQLDHAMSAIGANVTTGEGNDDIGEYDLMFSGDLQKWKTYANALKLRIALRAKGAPGENFAETAITQALANPLPTETIGIVKDLAVDAGIAQNDGWFTRYAGSRKTLSGIFVNTLQDNNDPRLSVYAEPIMGGTVVFENYSEASNKTKVDYLLANSLDRAGVAYTSNTSGDNLEIVISDGEHYVGMPMRFVDGMKTHLHKELFSRQEILTEGSYEIGQEIDRYIMTLAEINFMKAEAAVMGLGGNAQESFQAGIQASFNQWGVSDNGYLASPMATLSGSNEDQLNQIGLQSWLAAYMVGYQGFAIARDFAIPGITDDIPDLPELFSLAIPLGRSFPQRVKYKQAAYDLNGTNLQEAISRQGVDDNATILWFAKGTK